MLFFFLFFCFSLSRTKRGLVRSTKWGEDGRTIRRSVMLLFAVAILPKHHKEIGSLLKMAPKKKFFLKKEKKGVVENNKRIRYVEKQNECFLCA